MISVITPTHKKGKYWDLTVESVLQQTYKDFEWVVLDNSPDGYFEPEFERFKTEHPEYSDVFGNVKIYREVFDGRKPVGFYKNRCVELTTCGDDEFVVTFDHDDLMYRTALEDFVGCAEKHGPKIDYIFGHELSFEENSGKLAVYSPPGLHTFKGCSDYLVPNLRIGNTMVELKGISLPEIETLDYTYSSHIMPGSHPRVIKKRLLTTFAFRYNENSLCEDDSIQTTLATLFLNIGYIRRPTIVFISYKDSTAKMKRPENELIVHNRIQIGIYLLYEAVRMFKNYENMENKYFYYNREDFKTVDND